MARLAAVRSLSAFALRAMARCAPVRSAKEMCHSTKRTHRFLSIFLMQLPLHTVFATEMCGEFRWVRFGKRTHREGVNEVGRGVLGRLETFITRERGAASGPLALQIGQSRGARPADESVFAKVAPSARIRRVSSDSASTRQGDPRNMWLPQTTAASRRTRLLRNEPDWKSTV